MKPLKHIQTFFLSLIFLSSTTSCQNENKETNHEYYSNITGLWQYMYPSDTGLVGRTCIFFDTDCTWTSMHGCYDNEGTYWFENDVMGQKFNNGNSIDTSYEHILSFSDKEMVTCRSDFNDTLIYSKKNSTNYSDCGITVILD